jgi:hypothetical protein
MVECGDLTLLAADAFAYERPRRDPPSSIRRPGSAIFVQYGRAPDLEPLSTSSLELETRLSRTCWPDHQRSRVSGSALRIGSDIPRTVAPRQGLASHQTPTTGRAISTEVASIAVLLSKPYYHPRVVVGISGIGPMHTESQFWLSRSRRRPPVRAAFKPKRMPLLFLGPWAQGGGVEVSAHNEGINQASLADLLETQPMIERLFWWVAGRATRAAER